LVHIARTRRPQPKGNTRNARVPSASKSSEVKKNVTVEYHRRTLLLSKNQKTMSSECNNTKLAIWNDKSEIVCGTCKQCLVTANHDACLRSSVNALNSPTNNLCANVPLVQIKRDIRHNFDLKGKLVASKETNCPNDDKACTSNPQEPIRKWFPNSTVFLGRLSKFVCGFGNDHIAAILGYGDLKWGNITITRVYFVEGLGHNLFSVGQFCDADLEVAFRRNTCFIRDLDGVDLLKDNCSINLYTINLYDMASASPICLTARATPTKSWLWHQRLSHLNFDTINDLPKMISSPVYQSLNMLNNIFVPLMSKEKAKEPLTHPNLFRIQSSGFICFIWICVVQCELQALMQAQRAWYDELSTFLLQNGFSKGIIDPTLFTRRFDDDILVVNQSPCGIFINQSNYMNEILKKYGLNTRDIIYTLMDIKDKLDLDQIRTPVDATKYRSMIGAVMYLTSSRPDIVHATCDSGFEVTGFSDADYAGCKDTFNSTSGGAQFLGEKLMSCQNQRDLPKDTHIDRLEVLRYDIGKRSKVRMGIMSNETKLTLEQTQQVMMEIILEPTSSKLLVGDMGDCMWIKLMTLDINLGPE
nr:uncharacterized mitochondrial protein AtMg00810-like [Tanacetum cinerariifolium]